MSRPSPRFVVYAWLVVCVAVVAAAASLWRWSLNPSWQLVVLVFAAMAAEVLAVSLKRAGVVSLTYPLVVAGIVLIGPTAGAAIAAAASLPYLLPKRAAPVAKTAFNTGQFILMALAPGCAYVLLGGRALISRPLAASDFPALVLPLLFAAWVGVAVNFALAGAGYALLNDVPLRRVWRETVSWMLPSQLALGLVGTAIAQVMSVAGPAGFALFVIPLVVARQFHRRYQELRDAYSDTIKSLVAVIEAKDPCTKGHSERVSCYAVAIARHLGHGDEAAERLEQAALLHDVGKIGVSRAVLSKPSALTSDEYREVQDHPGIGARILESVPHLAEIVPSVRYHHERFDGGGYGEGLCGEQIPMDARILSVADSFDAMTSDRPYRSALTREAAVEEIKRHSGTQFDATVADALVQVLPSLSEPGTETVAS